MTITDRIYNAITANGCRELTEERFRQAMKEIAWEAWKEASIIDFGREKLIWDNEEQRFNDWFNKEV